MDMCVCVCAYDMMGSAIEPSLISQSEAVTDIWRVVSDKTYHLSAVWVFNKPVSK